MASSGDRPSGASGSRLAGLRIHLGEGLLHPHRPPSEDPPAEASAPDDRGNVVPPVPSSAPSTEAAAAHEADLAIRYLVAAVVASTLSTCLGLFASGRGGLYWLGGLVVTALLAVRGVALARRAQRVPYAAPDDFPVKVLTLLGLTVLMMVPYLLALVT